MLPRYSYCFPVISLAYLLTGACGAQHRDTWSFDDMTRECEPRMSLRVQIANSSDLFDIEFTLSTRALVNRRVYIHSSGGNFTAKHRVPCLYHGTNANNGDSVFASETRGLLKMTFRHNGSWYQAERLSDSSVATPMVAERFEAQEEEAANLCRYKTSPVNLTEQNVQAVTAGSTRSAMNLESFQGAVVEKQLEMALVLDQSFISKSGGNASAVVRALEIANFVNGLYQPLKLRVVLTDIIVWWPDKILIDSNSDATLDRFTAYKALRLSIRHDTVMLLSARGWDSGNTLGVAWLRATCKRLNSCGMVADTYPEAISTALVLTHEIGHNLGLLHMEEQVSCVCNRSSTGCIMNSYLASATRTEALGWSSCSVSTWNSQAGETWRSCLEDAAEASYSSSSGGVCGNGILEAGEQCDCGPAQTCSSKCCEASTCRLKSGATCASGPCCDWSTCMLRPRGQVCRTADSLCDVPETCSGTSEWCPSDDRVADGVDCASGQAFCYKGKCRTSDAQCQRLFSSSARSASSQCFTTLNVKSESLYGHCHMHLTNIAISSSITPTYSYVACASEDAQCGLQQCYQDSQPTVGNRVTFGTTVCYSMANIDVSSAGLRSPSLVPDGAKCGTSSMCVNSTCTPLSTVRACKSCPSCSGNGVLTTNKICFCMSGFSPPNCFTTGCGGSVTSPLACPASTEAATPTTTLTAVNRATPTNRTVPTPTPTTVTDYRVFSNHACLSFQAGRLALLGSIGLLFCIITFK